MSQEDKHDVVQNITDTNKLLTHTGQQMEQLTTANKDRSEKLPPGPQKAQVEKSMQDASHNKEVLAQGAQKTAELGKTLEDSKRVTPAAPTQTGPKI